MKKQGNLKGELTVMLTKSIIARKETVLSRTTPDSVHADLFKTLKAIRYDVAKEENVAAFQVFSDATLVEMATYLPLTMSDLANISGFGNLKLVKYGSLFLDPIIDYCRANQLATRMESKAPKRQRMINVGNKSTETKKISFQLFRTGKDIDEIAAERELKEEYH